MTAAATAAWAVAPVVGVDSEAALEASADQAHARAVVEVHPVWEAAAVAVVVVVLAVAAVVVAAVVVEAAVAEGDKRVMKQNKLFRSQIRISTCLFTATLLCMFAATRGSAQTSGEKKGRSFASAQEAANALIEAAEKYDEAALTAILGPNSYDIIHTGEPARDREVAQKFAEQARIKTSVKLQPKNPRRAILEIGEDDWPFAVPIVKVGSTWSFDSVAGRQELLYRRIGSNELDVIMICRSYVEAQHEYALQKRGTSGQNQYAQRIISTPGTQDGLAWQNSDGTWGGPIGENVAAAIARGYTNRAEPFHGYFF